jgi:hypothetical protein
MPYIKDYAQLIILKVPKSGDFTIYSYQKVGIFHFIGGKKCDKVIKRVRKRRKIEKNTKKQQKILKKDE